MRPCCYKLLTDLRVVICRLTSDHSVSIIRYNGFNKTKQVLELYGAILGDMIGLHYEVDRILKWQKPARMSKNPSFQQVKTGVLMIMG